MRFKCIFVVSVREYAAFISFNDKKNYGEKYVYFSCVFISLVADCAVLAIWIEKKPESSVEYKQIADLILVSNIASNFLFKE